eukprot:TRINITY_DN40757_c0_g1_i2.p1 TRINITY_DN40757_c0_g1~~TRINITY_DN40757_c0_g1_i2.p1  ORF type:complete len:624 (+),score=88.57 TRINITY_DN40757_c0_g1_i2:106-1977(+)
MITYRNTFFDTLLERRGSVVPKALAIAFPNALLTAFVKVLALRGLLELTPRDELIMDQSVVWSGFTALVGFLVIFRTSIAYSRFWDGATLTHNMRGNWFDACSALIAFTKCSKATPQQVNNFRHIIIRLFSMLHALALAEIEEAEVTGLSEHPQLSSSMSLDLIDVRGIDPRSLSTVRASDAKVELLFQWIQQTIVENFFSGVLGVPPPILSRVFQELSNGMVLYHEAMKISSVPFPLPYAQTCNMLLVVHWLMNPLITIYWVSSPIWAAVLSFVQVFILWTLHLISVEIQNPFGTDANDLDQVGLHLEMNQHLLLLLKPSTLTTPTLSKQAIIEEDVWMDMRNSDLHGSFEEVWTEMDEVGYKTDCCDQKAALFFVDAMARCVSGGRPAPRRSTLRVHDTDGALCAHSFLSDRHVLDQIINTRRKRTKGFQKTTKRRDSDLSGLRRCDSRLTLDRILEDDTRTAEALFNADFDMKDMAFKATATGNTLRSGSGGVCEAPPGPLSDDDAAATMNGLHSPPQPSIASPRTPKLLPPQRTLMETPSLSQQETPDVRQDSFREMDDMQREGLENLEPPGIVASGDESFTIAAITKSAEPPGESAVHPAIVFTSETGSAKVEPFVVS